jgi:hypothetical protein
MGTVSRLKHPSRRSITQGESWHEKTQTTFPTLKKEDLEYLLPIIKEIGKALYPPAAIPIELLYQLYTHADTIKEVASAVMKDDYKKAAEVVGKEAAKDMAESTLGKIEAPAVDKASDLLAENTTKNIEGKLEKETTSRVVKGTTKGAVESANKKIVDEITGEVLKRKQEK